ncbi:MAG: type ISP restriction/modification enzyme [Pseudanabaena sp.]
MSDIQHAHLYGMREAKYDWLSTHDVNSTNWNEIEPQKPFHLFIPQDNDLLSEYQEGWNLSEAMPRNLLGFQTHRDSIAIAYDKLTLTEQVKNFLGKEPDSDSWKNYCRQIDYRPFDTRIAYLGKEVTDRPRLDVVGHLFYENFALNLVRQTKASEWHHALVSRNPTPAVFIEIKDGSSIFPLYLYPNTDNLQQTTTEQRRPNFSDEFLTEITNKLGYTPTPEAIFYYIYAIFHSPTYRTRYAEFLKIDFPRVPLTSSDQLFRKLGEYGEELVALHLMKSPKLYPSVLSDTPLTKGGRGDLQIIDKGGEFVVDAGHPKYTDGEVIINKKGDRFTGVPESVWEFYVGGYQVCHKWLKDRKGRQLSPEDLNHYQKIIVALSETMQIMKAIDAAIPSFPIE